MKNSTREFLLQFIQNHYLNDEYTIHQLFYEEYAKLELSSIDNLLTSIDEYFDFFFNHIPQIKFHESTVMQNKIPNLIENAKFNILLWLSENSFDTQTKFVNAVSNVFDNPNEKSILDVGPGQMPLSSLLLTKKFKKVTAMDSHFFLSKLALKNMNIIPISQFFTTNTPLNDYDFIVGRAPCDAIEAIVENCANKQKPYLIQLCPCNVKPQFVSNEPSYGWENILPKLDSNIRFYGSFAYNLQNIPNHILDALKEFAPKSPKYKKIDIFDIKQKKPSSVKLPANEIEFD